MVLIDEHGNAHDKRGLFTTKLFAQGDMPDIEEDPWLDKGYSDADITRLERINFDVDEANRWRDKGFNADDTFEWSVAGFSLEEASELRANDFEPNQKSRHVKKAQEARMLIDAGLTLQEACDWTKVVSSVVGVPLDYVGEMSPDSYRYVADGGTYGSAAKRAIEWHDTGFTLEEATTWFNVFTEARQAAQYAKEGFSHLDAKEWFDKARLLPNRARDWHAAGFTPENVRPWHDMNITRVPSMAAPWRDAGCTPEEVSQWHADTGLDNPEEAIKWKAAGFHLKDAYKYVAAGVHDANTAAKLRDRGISPADFEYED
jgi:hypothetical protein